MSNDLNNVSNTTHIYKLKWGVLARNILSLGFMGIVFGIPLIALVMMLVSFFQSNPAVDGFFFMMCLIVPMVILLGFNLIQMIIGTIMSFFSYVKVSPDGIEQMYSPNKHIGSKWSEVDKLGKYLFTDVIYLNSYEVLGLSLSLKSPLRFLHPKQGFISLTGYEGWSDGQLASDLKQYAPELFENQTTNQEIHPENLEGQATELPSESQQVRLLAAISHASILFPSVGFFVSAGIYLLQKNESSYIAFQALQAIIWQIVETVFNMLIAFCMVGLLLITALTASSAQTENIIGWSSGGMFFVMIISFILMFVAKLVFVIYGFIGAVMTYQGKDFRYVIIGNLIKRGKGEKSAISI